MENGLDNIAARFRDSFVHLAENRGIYMIEDAPGMVVALGSVGLVEFTAHLNRPYDYTDADLAGIAEMFIDHPAITTHLTDNSLYHGGTVACVSGVRYDNNTEDMEITVKLCSSNFIVG